MRCFVRSDDPKSKQIDQDLKKARKEKMSMKLLLLGTGDSGKSTFLKQMKLLHTEEFSDWEIMQFQIVLQENLLSSMKRILENDEVVVPKLLKKDKAVVMAARGLTEECISSIEALWGDDVIKEAFDNRSELKIQVPSNADYFFQNAKRFAVENFKPSSEDIIRAKLKTTGISEIKFETEGVVMTIVDVGGQRSERRKWLHCFDSVKSVIYLAALDEYNMKLEEDDKTNRLEESLQLFGEMTSSQIFQPASWILFLNKSDIFEKKIQRWPIKNYFKNCTSKNYEESVNFIQTLYENQFKGQNLYVHITCAIDVQNCKRVFMAVKDTLLTSALSAQGVL